MARLWTMVHSLKFRLTVGAVLSLAVGMGIVAVLLVWQTERDTLLGDEQRQMSETVRVAKVLSRRVVELQRALKVTAEKLTPETVADRLRLAAFIGSQPVLNSMFSSVFVVGSDGRMLLLQRDGTQSFPGTDLTDRAYIRDSLIRGGPRISGAIESRVSGRAIIGFSYPLMRGGHSYGVLAGSLNIDSRDLIADVVEDDDSGTLLAVSDLDGKVLAHPQSQAVLTSMATQPRFNQAFQDWVASGAAAEPAGIRLAQPSDLVSACGVAGTDWMVWRAVPKEDLLSPLRAARTHALKLVAALLVLTSALTFALLAWVLRPLRQLSDRAQHLFDGSQAAGAGWPRAGGELGQLTNALRHAVDERMQYQALNEDMLKRLSSIMGAAPIGIAFTRAQKFELVSAELCRLLGRSEQALIGQGVDSIHHDRDEFQRMAGMLEAAMARGESYEGECWLERADGTTFCAELRGSMMDETNRAAGVIWTVSDITVQVASRARLEWSAGHDTLTGLANRVLLDQRLRGVFGQPGAVDWTAVLVIDLDHFKPVNDLGGHAAGDEMLRRVAHAITHCVRASDLVARTGGDEFALVLEGCPLATAVRIAEKVRHAIAAIELEHDGRRLRVGASIGVSHLVADTGSVEAWIADADRLCYEAKRAGRNTVRTSSIAALESFCA